MLTFVILNYEMITNSKKKMYFIFRECEERVHRPVHPQRGGPPRGPGGVQRDSRGRYTLLQQGRAQTHPINE